MNKIQKKTNDKVSLARIGDSCFFITVGSDGTPRWKTITVVEWKRLGGVIQ